MAERTVTVNISADTSGFEHAMDGAMRSMFRWWARGHPWWARYWTAQALVRATKPWRMRYRAGWRQRPDPFEALTGDGVVV